MIKSLKRTFGFIQQHPLAKQHLIKAYIKLVLWQIRSKLNPNLQAIKFIGKTYFLAKKGLTGVTGNIYTGLHEFEDMSFLLHLLRSDDTFFDVGANVGSYTLLAAGVCSSKVVSFEPIPATFNILKQNIELNRLHNFVQLENKGVGRENGTLHFTSTEDTTNHIITNRSNTEDSIAVPAVKLNEFLLYEPVLLKIDVEGYETEVINGAEKILKNLSLKAIIIELNGSEDSFGFDEAMIHQKLFDYGFRPYTYNPFERKLYELKKFGTFNTIYVRDLKFVEFRLSNAAAFKVFGQKI